MEILINFFINKMWSPAVRLIQRCINKRTPISKRLNSAIELLRESNTTQETFSDTKLAEAMGLEKLSDFKRILNGTDEPRFKQLEKFAETFGINSEWLKHGETPIFLLGESPMFTNKKFLEELQNLKPEKLYFIRENTDRAEVAIAIDQGNNKYITYPEIINLSRHLGGTGRSQLYHFHSFVKTVFEKTNLLSLGRTIDKDDFEGISQGELYAGAVISKRWEKTQNWWEDFIFLYSNDSEKQSLINKYGQSFVDAQDIVRKELRRDENKKLLLG